MPTNGSELCLRTSRKGEYAGMLEKKVMTLGCAVGILACGACFLPPLPERQPPPPPVRLDMQGIRKIRVEVSNNSESHHLDPNALGSWIEIRISAQARAAGVKAFSKKDPASTDADAVLRVTVLSETAAPERGTAEPERPDSTGIDEQWNFQVNLSAVLAKKDGQVVWRESDGEYRFSKNYPPLDGAALLRHPELQNWLTLAVGRRLVARMLSAQ